MCSCSWFSKAMFHLSKCWRNQVTIVLPYILLACAISMTQIKKQNHYSQFWNLIKIMFGVFVFIFQNYVAVVLNFLSSHLHFPTSVPSKQQIIHKTHLCIYFLRWASIFVSCCSMFRHRLRGSQWYHHHRTVSISAISVLHGLKHTDCYCTLINLCNDLICNVTELLICNVIVDLKNM